MEWGEIEKSPANITINKKENSTYDPNDFEFDQEQIWDKNQVQRALNEIQHLILKEMIMIQFICILRLGELCTLTWDSIDFKNSNMIVNKAIQRVNVESINAIQEKEQILKVFPPIKKRTVNNTAIILKIVKIEKSR